MKKALLKRYNIIGNNIRYYRKLKGLTQDQLAFAAYMRSRGHMSSIERGSQVPSLTVLLKIAEALSISPAFLLVDPSSNSSEGFFRLYMRLGPRSKVEVKRYMEALLEESSRAR